MSDPITTLTAGVILDLALKKFLETSAGEAAKAFSQTALKKMDDLRQVIWAKLRGKPRFEAVKKDIEQQAQITPEQLKQLEPYLQIAMDEDQAFARQIQQLAHEITLEQVQDNSAMNQTNYGGTNYQVKTGKDNTNYFGGSHHHR